MTLAAGALGQWNIDMSRHARERLSPQDYARFSYYEKWISALADLLVETGVLSLDELRRPGSGNAWKPNRAAPGKGVKSEANSRSKTCAILLGEKIPLNFGRGRGASICDRGRCFPSVQKSTRNS